MLHLTDNAQLLTVRTSASVLFTVYFQKQVLLEPAASVSVDVVH